MRGRKPKPPVLRLLEGNPGKRPIPDVVQPETGAHPPKCPAWLEPDAKKEWKRIAQELCDLGLLSNLDVVALAAYCQAYARYKEAEQLISEHGATYTHINKFGAENEMLRAHVYMSKIQLQFIRQFCAEFGLTPSARARMVLPKDEEEDPFDAFVKRAQQRRTGT